MKHRTLLSILRICKDSHGDHAFVFIFFLNWRPVVFFVLPAKWRQEVLLAQCWSCPSLLGSYLLLYLYEKTLPPPFFVTKKEEAHGV